MRFFDPVFLYKHWVYQRNRFYDIWKCPNNWTEKFVDTGFFNFQCFPYSFPLNSRLVWLFIFHWTLSSWISMTTWILTKMNAHFFNGYLKAIRNVVFSKCNCKQSSNTGWWKPGFSTISVFTFWWIYMDFGVEFRWFPVIFRFSPHFGRLDLNDYLELGKKQ